MIDTTGVENKEEEEEEEVEEEEQSGVEAEEKSELTFLINQILFYIGLEGGQVSPPFCKTVR